MMPPKKSPVAEEWQRVGNRLFVWSAYCAQVKTELWSTAYWSVHGLVLVDPVMLADEALEELTAVTNIHAVVCTNGNHARAAAAYRERFDVPVLCTAAASDELETTPDQMLAVNKSWCGLRVLPVPGAGPGELALLVPGDLLMLGDAVINAEPYGLSLLPDKYCTDPKRLPAAIRALCGHNFHHATFAHGSPLVAKAREKLAALV